jgi:7-cyano-7-deazaguanine synthase
MIKEAIALLSGGMDSVTAAAMLKSQGYDIYALTVSYGQRHSREIECAKRLAIWLGAKEHEVIDLPISRLLKSSLMNPEDDVTSKGEKTIGSNIPTTYVPSRNAILLTIAAAWAESIGAEAIVIGVNAIDYSGYPDCGQPFIDAFEKVIKIGTKGGVEGHPVKILAPLAKMSKEAIVRKGIELGVPFKETWSCYSGGNKPCGVCDSCLLRRKGFAEAGISDPALAPEAPRKAKTS